MKKFAICLLKLATNYLFQLNVSYVKHYAKHYDGWNNLRWVRVPIPHENLAPFEVKGFLV